MSFLRVNGWAIPCGQISKTPIEIGSRRRSFNGQPHVGRRAIKGSWKGRTTRQLPSIARAIEGAILGLGESFPYDSDLYSGGGLGTDGATTGTIRPGVAGDGLTIYEEATAETESKFGAGSLSVELAATNILPADARDAENAPTGYTAVGGAGLAADTTHYVQGAKGVEVTAGGAGQGVVTDTGTSSVSTAYVASVYVHNTSAGPRSVQVDLIENAATSLGNTVAVLAAGAWYRIEVAGTTGAGGVTLKIQITASGGALTFICDNFQIELGTVATSWADGSRAASTLTYPSVFTGYDLTFAAWVRGPVATTVDNKALFFAEGLPNLNYILCYRLGGSSSLVLTEKDSAGVATSTVISSVFDGEWHHVAFTAEAVGDLSTRRTTIYVDGVATASSAPKEVDPTAWTVFYIGGRASVWKWLDLIDDVVATPYAMTPGQITALYGLGQALSPLPRVYIDGDFLAAPPLTQLAVGKVPGMPYMDGGVGGTFHTDLQETEFTLDAV